MSACYGPPVHSKLLLYWFLFLLNLVPNSAVTITSNTSGLVWPGIDSVSLECTASGTNVNYSWSLQGKPLPQVPQYKLTGNNSILIISPVSFNNSGPFTCTASNSTNSETSKGLNFTLGCSGSFGNSTWNMNGEPLPQDPRYDITQSDFSPYSSLLISPVSMSVTGPFTCTASNKMSNNTSNAVTLTLAWYPGGNIACTAEFVAQNIQLGCSWPGGWPAANVTMKFNREIHYGQSYVFTNVSPVSTIKGSNLTCFGNQLGKTSACTVTFEFPQSTGYNGSSVTIVTEGDTAVLTLNLTDSGLPAVFTWYSLDSNVILDSLISKSTIESTNSSSSLQIFDVDVEDAGQYLCIASNIIGNQSFLFTLNVTEQGFQLVPSSKERLIIVLSEIAIFMVIFAVVVFCVVKRSKGSTGEHGDNLPSICERTIAAEREKAISNEESNYEQLRHKDNAMYGTLAPSVG